MGVIIRSGIPEASEARRIDVANRVADALAKRS